MVSLVYYQGAQVAISNGVSMILLFSNIGIVNYENIHLYPKKAIY